MNMRRIVRYDLISVIELFDLVARKIFTQKIREFSRFYTTLSELRQKTHEIPYALRNL